MNRWKTKQLVQQNGVIALKADKTQESPEADALLIELGNAGKTLPFYAIFPPDGKPPITFDGPITQEMILTALQQAGPSRPQDQARTAMR